METSTLRWVMIVIGLIIIALIFLFGNPEKKRGPRASRRSRAAAAGRAGHGEKPRREPTLGPPPDAEGAGSEGLQPGQQGELQIGEDSARPAARPAPQRPAGPPPDRIVTLYLLAQDQRLITGAQLLEAAVKTGMDFGDMNIFHRLTEGASQPVFSLANAAKPGHFDRSAWHEFETAGLVLFMTLPGPVFALDAWDAMLATARRMAGILGAELQDEQHHAFSRQREAQIREDMRAYDRKSVTRAT